MHAQKLLNARTQALHFTQALHLARKLCTWHASSALGTQALHLACKLCTWHPSSALGTQALHLAPELCTWHASSALGTRALHLAPELCTWHASSALGTRALHLAPELCTWHASSALGTQAPPCNTLNLGEHTEALSSVLSCQIVVSSVTPADSFVEACDPRAGAVPSLVSGMTSMMEPFVLSCECGFCDQCDDVVPNRVC